MGRISDKVLVNVRCRVRHRDNVRLRVSEILGLGLSYD